jgi:hypothetical protein
MRQHIRILITTLVGLFVLIRPHQGIALTARVGSVGAVWQALCSLLPQWSSTMPTCADVLLWFVDDFAGRPGLPCVYVAQWEGSAV